MKRKDGKRRDPGKCLKGKEGNDEMRKGKKEDGKEDRERNKTEQQRR